MFVRCMVALVALVVLLLLAVLNPAAAVPGVPVVGIVLTALFNQWPKQTRKRKHTTKPRQES